MQPDAVLYLVLADIVQVIPPAFQVVKNANRLGSDEDVSSVTTVHGPLCIIDSPAEGVPPVGDSGTYLDRPGINAHAKAQVGMAADCL